MDKKEKIKICKTDGKWIRVDGEYVIATPEGWLYTATDRCCYIPDLNHLMIWRNVEITPNTEWIIVHEDNKSKYLEGKNIPKEDIDEY